MLAELIFIWLAFGLSFWLVFPPDAGYLAQVVGAFSLSWLAGYVAFFAPGGIGVREVLLAVLLGAFLCRRGSGHLRIDPPAAVGAG